MCIFIYNLYIYLPSSIFLGLSIGSNMLNKTNKDINAVAATPESQNEQHGWGQDWNVRA